MQANAPGCDRLQGFYRGIVLKHLSKGKCKIWIPTVHPEEWNSYGKADMLPDAEQASPISFGTNNGLGIFSYPNIGSIVWCFFENGDQNLPVYFAASLGGPEAISQWDSSRRMAGNHPDDAYIHHMQVKNADVYIYETGVIEMTTHDDQSINSCSLTMDHDGNVIINSTAKIELKSKQISINAETQIDENAPKIKKTALVHSATISPAIELDSSLGHTQIKSIASTTLF